MNHYEYLKSITANPRQLHLDLNAVNAGQLQASRLYSLGTRGWGHTPEEIRLTARRLNQLIDEAGKYAVQNMPDARTEQWAAHLAAAGIPTEKGELSAWFRIMYPNRPSTVHPPESRPADYYDREPLQLWGLNWIELPPECRTGSFTKAVTKAYASPAVAVQELKSRATLPAGDLLLKMGYDCRWQIWQRRQVTGRGYSLMGSFAKRAPLGSGRLFIQ